MRKPRGKLKGCGVAALVAVGGLALVVFVGRASFRKAGDRQLAEVTTKLDADDPGWRFEAIEAARVEAAPPDEVNAARVVVSVHDRLPGGWDQPLTNDSGVGGPVWNTRPGFWQFVALAQALAAAGDVPAAARDDLLRPDVLRRPGGYIRLTFKDNPFTILLPEVQKLRSAYALLDADAGMAALAGDPNRGVRDARALLVAARAVGDEPILISQLVRMAGAKAAGRTAVQVLAWGEPTDGLADLQAELLAEAAHPGYLIGLRGERALMDKFFEGLAAGKVGVKDLKDLQVLGTQYPPPDAVLGAGFLLYQGFLPGDRAECLRLFGDHIAAARLPPHEQAAAIAAVPLPPRPPESYRYLVTSHLLPFVGKAHAGYLRTRTDLRTAAVAIACERFRRKTGRWPESLAGLPKDILPELPADPVTGGPLGYSRTADGVAVFGTYTEEERPKTGHPRADDPLGGLGRGWRLWDPKFRGVMASLPKSMAELLREEQPGVPPDPPGKDDEP
ncbi:MAG: hypothetical protein K2X87_04440 [Gemmataceae bacterium]|nr:hypothetical protein [Gemmataceae bacterium]